MAVPAFSPADVRKYYDRNTPAFVRLGQGGGAIHRAVWGPGVETRDQAFTYIDALIADQVRPLLRPDRPVHVVDLGCGVGASLCYLARALTVRGTGVTLSPVQARMAAARIAADGLGQRVRCVVGDFTSVPAEVETAAAAYAIESFVHGSSPERFFAEAARLVVPGGLLIVCDDVQRDVDDPRAAGAIELFRRGWHVNTLVTRAEMQRLAADAGFAAVQTVDLTPFLELNRPRDRAIAWVAALARRLPATPAWLAPLLGGSALQEGLQNGWLAYECTTFRRL